MRAIRSVVRGSIPEAVLWGVDSVLRFVSRAPSMSKIVWSRDRFWEEHVRKKKKSDVKRKTQANRLAKDYDGFREPDLIWLHKELREHLALQWRG